MAKTQKTVASAVAATVAPTVITPPVNVLVVDPRWREFGTLDSQSEKSSSERIALIASMLKDAPYPVWIAFNAEYCAGAKEDGYGNPADLLSRRVTKPLALLGVVRPVSATSTNARAKTPEQQAKADAAKAEADALAAMTEKACDAEIKAGKADVERLAKLYARKVAAHKAEEKAVVKAAKEKNAKLYNACQEQLKLMALDDAKLKRAHTSLVAINK